MSQSQILKSFLEGNPAKNIRIVAARGVVPLPPNELLLLQVYLTRDADSDVVTEAQGALRTWSEEDILTQVQSDACDSLVLEYFASASDSNRILEAIILNPATQDQSIANLASRVQAQLLELILFNRVRLLQTPEILERIKQNPNGTTQIQRLIQEIENEFFGSKKSEYVLEEPTTKAEQPVEELLDLETELTAEDLSLEGLPLDPAEREKALLERLSKMPPPKKIRIAMQGTREARAILIRDNNKQVSKSVLKSPKLTENEVESFAAMRSLSDEILRDIGSNRAWARNYVVAHNLVKNPKTPPMISMRLLQNLHSKDLQLLLRDRTVSDAVRRSAQQALTRRTAHK